MLTGVGGMLIFLWSPLFSWVGRLRTVGIQRGAQEGEDTEASEFEFGEHMQHRRTGSTQSIPYDDHDAGMPSPFFSGSSTNWGSSIPSTPGGGAHTPAYGFAGGAPSPSAMAMAIPIGAMSLNSRYNTPKSVAASLPEEEEEEGADDPPPPTGAVGANAKLPERLGAVRVVGMDAEDDGARGVQKMDVDV